MKAKLGCTNSAVRTLLTRSEVPGVIARMSWAGRIDTWIIVKSTTSSSGGRYTSSAGRYVGIGVGHDVP